MDLDEHIYLRTFVKPDIAPILKAVIAALIVHVLLFISWQSNHKTNAAAVPQWVNVKLVAYFETDNKKISPTKKLKKKLPNNKIIEKRKADVKSVKKDNITTNKIEKYTAKETTFIKADSRPYKLKNPKPVYPSAARRRGMQGVVLLKVKINKKGFVEYVNIEKTSGFRVLDQSAVSSISQWRFIPAKKENEFVASIVQLPIRFYLNDV